MLRYGIRPSRLFTHTREHISKLFMNGRIRCVSELLTRIQLVSWNATSYTRKFCSCHVLPKNALDSDGTKKKVGGVDRGAQLDVHFRRLLRNVIWIFDSSRVVTYITMIFDALLSFGERFYSGFGYKGI